MRKFRLILFAVLAFGTCPKAVITAIIGVFDLVRYGCLGFCLFHGLPSYSLADKITAISAVNGAVRFIGVRDETNFNLLNLAMNQLSILTTGEILLITGFATAILYIRQIAVVVGVSDLVNHGFLHSVMPGLGTGVVVKRFRSYGIPPFSCCAD